jgi:hydrogenase nickel incorporation protein HypA/HybF
MHEISLMQDALILAAKRATEAGGQRIHRLTMRVGPLSGAVPDAMEFAFELVAKGTMAEGATLEIQRAPIVCYCPTCSTEFQPSDFVCECPTCHQPSADVRGGRELELASLEVS